MLRPVSPSGIYLHRAPIDMRKQIDGLAALVEGAMKLNPFQGAVFVFINRSRNKLKALYFDRSGFVVWYKRLEQETFPWPVRACEEVVTLTDEQLKWLLDGYDVWKMKPHRTLEFACAR
jgi:transposase